MKPHLSVLILMAGLLALLNLPAKAQEKGDAPPPAPPPRQPDKPGVPPPPQDRPRGDREREPERGREPERAPERPVAYLGVLTGPVSREMRAQFGLAEGFGLQVVEVMPDSPAQTAGLKEHDVLVLFEDQKLVNMEQLQTLVRSRKKDDTVNLTIITGGQQKQVGVKIGERMARIEEEGRPRGGFMPMMPPWSGGPFGHAGGGDEWRERLENFQRQMREYQEQVQKWAREGREGPMPMPPNFDPPREGRDGWRGHDDRRPDMHQRERGPGGPPDGEGRRMDGPRDMPPPSRGGQGEVQRSERREYHESASITRSDDSGIYRLSREGGRAVFSVKPREGEPKEWPVNTEAERAAVPEPFRAKLREMEEIRGSVREDGERAPQPPGRRGD
jgi:hypothetical protein